MVRDWTHIERPNMSRAEARDRLQLLQERVICLHAGNMGFKQGLENVIECARLAQQKEPSFQFVFVGDGNQRNALQELAAQYDLTNVLFLPFQPKDFFPNMLACADVLLLNQLASVIDMSLPSKITSYLASGRPVVAAVAPESEAAREIKQSGGGIVVPPEDPEALLDALLGVTQDTDLQNELGFRGQAYAKEALSPKASLEALDEFVAAAFQV
jgi:glycosyltransferase involved in cell wall biosynthesis